MVLTSIFFLYEKDTRRPTLCLGSHTPRAAAKPSLRVWPRGTSAGLCTGGVVSMSPGGWSIPGGTQGGEATGVSVMIENAHGILQREGEGGATSHKPS